MTVVSILPNYVDYYDHTEFTLDFGNLRMTTQRMVLKINEEITRSMVFTFNNTF